MRPGERMKRLLIILFVSFLFTSCKKENVDPIDISLLNSEWKVVEQSINNEPRDPFIQIIKVKISGQDSILWVDTIDCGNSVYFFDNGLINTCNLHTENFGSFSGKWNFDISQNKLNINYTTTQDTTWNNDTVMNGHTIYYELFILKSYEIKLLTETKLEMTTEDCFIKLEKE